MNGGSRRAFLAGSGAVAGAFATSSRASVAADLTPVKIAATASESASNVFYAQDLGFFRDHGLDVQLQLLGSSGAYVNGIISGTFDVGAVASGSLVTAYCRGLPFALVANGGVYSAATPQTMLFVARASSLRTAADFKGKTIAVSTLRDITQVSVMAWIDRNGGDLQSVTFVELSPPSMLPALAQGRVDAAFIGEPFLTPALAQAIPIAACSSMVANRFLVVGWATSRNWLTANRVTALRLRAAFDQADAWALRNRGPAGEILGKYAHIPPEIVQKMRHVDWAPGASANLLQPVIDLMAEYGVIERSYRASELL